MSTITFDTLKFANTLKEVGVPDKQAEAQARVQNGHIHRRRGCINCRTGHAALGHTMLMDTDVLIWLTRGYDKVHLKPRGVAVIKPKPPHSTSLHTGYWLIVPGHIDIAGNTISRRIAQSKRSISKSWFD